MKLIDKIRNSGFEIELNGDDFNVTPDSKLTQQQREFSQANREEIMRELLLTEVFTIWGVPMLIQANDAKHKAWLIEVNHKSSTPSHLTMEFSND